MRKPLDMDDVEELEFGARTPDEHGTAAEILVGWATEQHPDDDAEVTPAVLLVKAGEQLNFAGDAAGALELFRRAQGADGDVLPDVRCYLHHGLVKVGDLAGAPALRRRFAGPSRQIRTSTRSSRTTATSRETSPRRTGG